MQDLDPSIQRIFYFWLSEQHDLDMYFASAVSENTVENKSVARSSVRWEGEVISA